MSLGEMLIAGKATGYKVSCSKYFQEFYPLRTLSR